MELFTVAFFGHRRIEDLLHTEERLENYVRTLLREKGIRRIPGGKQRGVRSMRCFRDQTTPKKLSRR